MKNKLLKQKYRRSANKRVDEKGESKIVDLQKIKNKVSQYYAKKPKLVIGSSFAFLFVFLLIMFTGNNETDTQLTENIPQTITFVNPDQSSNLQNKPAVVNSTFTDFGTSDAPLIEEELQVPLIGTDVVDDAFVTSEQDTQAIELDIPNEENSQETITHSINAKSVSKDSVSKKTVAESSLSPKSESVSNLSETNLKSWVFKKKPDQYTIQLIAGANKKDILKFMEKNKSIKRMSYFNTIKAGKNWYVVVQSTYDSFEAANKFRKTLPRQVAKNKPWIRPYSSIQKEIVANAEKINLLNSAFAETD